MTHIERAKEIMNNDLISVGYELSDIDDKWYLEYFQDTPIHSEVIAKHRWWSIDRRVILVGDNYIQFDWAITSGDKSASDRGWEFDWNSVKVVKKEQRQIIVDVYMLDEQFN